MLTVRLGSAAQLPGGLGTGHPGKVPGTLQRFKHVRGGAGNNPAVPGLLHEVIRILPRPPFTLQRIAELIVDTDKYYKSSRKLLYAFEKVRPPPMQLVNVCDPEE